MLLVLPEIKELLSQNKKEQLKKIFYDYEPIEIVEILKEFSLKDKVFLFSLLNIDFAADIFEKTDKDDQLTLLGAFDKTRRVDFFEQLPEEMVLRFLSIMEEEEAQDVRELMRYDKNTAGGRMTTDFAQIEKGITVEQTLRSLRKTAKDLEMIYYIYVADRTDKLLGVVSLKDLIIAQPEREIDEIMHTKLIAIPIDMDQEQVAKRIARYDFLALPVIDKEGKIKGIITVDDLIDVIREEDTEDMYKFGAAGKHIAGF